MNTILDAVALSVGYAVIFTAVLAIMVALLLQLGTKIGTKLPISPKRRKDDDRKWTDEEVDRLLWGVESHE